MGNRLVMAAEGESATQASSFAGLTIPPAPAFDGSNPIYGYNYYEEFIPPPQVATVSPDGQAPVTVPTPTLMVEFDRDVACPPQGCVAVSSQTGGSVAGDETVDGHSVTFAVSETLASDATYVVTVTAAQDRGRDLVMQVPYTWTFTTGDLGAPQVVDKGPPADAVDVALGSVVVVDFDEPVACTRPSADCIVLNSSRTGMVVGELAVDGAQAVFAPTGLPGGKLEENTEYQVEVNYFVDLAPNQNQMTDVYTWTFSTVYTAPHIVSTAPYPGEIGTPLDQVLVVTFSEPITCPVGSGCLALTNQRRETSVYGDPSLRSGQAWRRWAASSPLRRQPSRGNLDWRRARGTSTQRVPGSPV
ncbi:MAG: Ig-like domain-containing protein [Anaerolineae bacterium]|nr:Ig-like domain-containing protein [Anaerolineae bacterium]